VWLVGISIGGLGTMLYAQMRPQDIAGVVALAPYLGTRLTAQDIENAGGLSQWLAPPFSVLTDLDAGLWRWLQVQTTGGPALGGKIPLFLGYGLSDRFVFNARLLDRALPRDRVFTAKGGHDWPVWNDLWKQMAAELPIEHRDDCLRQGPG
jgi:pimeloyl-ACP methyl ester carboxylesterase